MNSPFEISSSRFEKGLWSLDLERVSWPQGLVRLGPIRGRLLAFTFFISATLMSLSRQPGLWLWQNSWINSEQMALLLQKSISWGVLCLGLIFWIGAFLLRKEKLSLVLDRQRQVLEWSYKGKWSKLPNQSGVILFKHFNGLNYKSHQDLESGGVLTVTWSCSDSIAQDLKNGFSMRLLSREQGRFYPSNFFRLTDIRPQGDWNEDL